MALSNRKILEEKEKGNIVIDPFDKKNLSTSSFDVTLGEFYFRENKTKKETYNPCDRENVEELWGSPQRAQHMKDIVGFESLKGVREDEKIIVIDPGETILAHTEEYIGARNKITTMMKARSSAGRNFIEVCKCAGWGDVGYVNRWTMEITNNSRFHKIPLIVGRRIAQIIFFETGETLESDNDYSQKGKYQSTDNLDEIKKSWKPEDMIPKMYKDYEINKN